jgi:glycyl-tRNA synthetase
LIYFINLLLLYCNLKFDLSLIIFYKIHLAEILIENEISHRIDITSGSIGKRYSKADEIGTRYALTLDYQTIEDSKTVTLRDRDSTKQIRIKV